MKSIPTIQVVAVEDTDGKRRYVPYVQWVNKQYTELHLCSQFGYFAHGMPMIQRSAIVGAWCDRKNHSNRFRSQ